MRPSFRSAGSFVTLVSSLFVASVAIVACGGETASLGSQGSEQGAGGNGSTGGTGGGSSGAGGGSSGAGGSGAIGCPTIAINCDPATEYKTYSAQGCEQCVACPDVPPFVGDCPNGSRDVRDMQTGCVVKTVCKDDDECPALTPPHPDFCKGGVLVPTTDESGCPASAGCQCPPEQACPPNTKAVPRPNGACGSTCEPSSCPEIVEPGPNQCPSGGFAPKYGADGCIVGFDCISCPVLGDPSFCADGTVRVAIKDGKCDYGNISCQPCAAASPPVVGWCNDGAIIVKKDGKCLDAAECQCPIYGACPPNSVGVGIPGSHCGAFECNDVSCPTVQQPSGLSCDGKFSWERDANGCISTLICNAPE